MASLQEVLRGVPTLTAALLFGSVARGVERDVIASKLWRQEAPRG